MHIDNLEYHLAMIDPHLTLDHHLKLVTTWEAFSAEVDRFQPDLVYYYGHGTGDNDQAHLIFATETQNQPVKKPIVDFAQVLRTIKPLGSRGLASFNRVSPIVFDTST